MAGLPRASLGVPFPTDSPVSLEHSLAMLLPHFPHFRLVPLFSASQRFSLSVSLCLEPGISSGPGYMQPPPQAQTSQPLEAVPRDPPGIPTMFLLSFSTSSLSPRDLGSFLPRLRMKKTLSRAGQVVERAGESESGHLPSEPNWNPNSSARDEGGALSLQLHAVWGSQDSGKGPTGAQASSGKTEEGSHCSINLGRGQEMDLQAQLGTELGRRVILTRGRAEYMLGSLLRVYIYS